jgi:hypothetical protein
MILVSRSGSPELVGNRPRPPHERPTALPAFRLTGRSSDGHFRPELLL